MNTRSRPLDAPHHLGDIGRGLTARIEAICAMGVQQPAERARIEDEIVALAAPVRRHDGSHREGLDEQGRECPGCIRARLVASRSVEAPPS